MMKQYYAQQVIYGIYNGSPNFIDAGEFGFESYGSKEHVLQHFKDLGAGSLFTPSLGVALMGMKDNDIKYIYKVVNQDDNEVVGYLYE